MICQYCKKNEALIDAQVVINGVPVVLSLCENCARKFGVSMPSNKPVGSAYISAFFGETKNNNIYCPVCGMSQSEFMKTGYLGCTKCYQVFSNVVDVAESFQGKRKHVGKYPLRQLKNMEDRKIMSDLQLELRKAVENEDFEHAAILKQKIEKIGGANGK